MQSLGLIVRRECKRTVAATWGRRPQVKTTYQPIVLLAKVGTLAFRLRTPLPGPFFA